MLRLNTFGGLVLQQDGQLHTGPAAQRRRLALLAVEAAAGRRGVSRDKLLSLLWPDSETEAARHSLYQAIHAIRWSAGSEEIFQLETLPAGTGAIPKRDPSLRSG